jgi:hypothetical protein
MEYPDRVPDHQVLQQRNCSWCLSDVAFSRVAGEEFAHPLPPIVIPLQWDTRKTRLDNHSNLPAVCTSLGTSSTRVPITPPLQHQPSQNRTRTCAPYLPEKRHADKDYCARGIASSCFLAWSRFLECDTTRRIQTTTWCTVGTESDLQGTQSLNRRAVNNGQGGESTCTRTHTHRARGTREERCGEETRPKARPVCVTHYGTRGSQALK